MVWCIFKRTFLSKAIRDECVPTIEDIFVKTPVYNYIFTEDEDIFAASNHAANYLGETISDLLSMSHDSLYFVYGYFRIDANKSPKVIYNYVDLILPTHYFC